MCNVILMSMSTVVVTHNIFSLLNYAHVCFWDTNRETWPSHVTLLEKFTFQPKPVRGDSFPVIPLTVSMFCSLRNEGLQPITETFFFFFSHISSSLTTDSETSWRAEAEMDPHGSCGCVLVPTTPDQGLRGWRREKLHSGFDWKVNKNKWSGPDFLFCGPQVWIIV